MTDHPALLASRPRWLSPATLVLVFLASLAAFLSPQPAPLQWYPLNHTQPGTLYLTARLAGDRNGEARLGYRLATEAPDRWRTIRIPISPTEEKLTYTFPLPDAPIAAIRLEGINSGGTLRIADLQITDRRSQPQLCLDPDLFRLVSGGAILPGPDDWSLRTDAAPPVTAEHTLPIPLLAEGATARNASRCLKSVGYLAGMTALLMGAITLALWRPRPAELPSLLAYLALVGLAVSTVSHRGLIRETISVARYVTPPALPGLSFEVELSKPDLSPAQLFWDIGRGINQADSARATVADRDALQVLRFALPPAPLRALRFDPGDAAGVVQIRTIRVVDRAGRIRRVLSPRSLLAGQHVRCEPAAGDSLRVVCTEQDPTTALSPDALSAVNRALAEAG